MFPGLARYDEVGELKEIRHALRFTVTKTWKAYIYPGSDWASVHTDAGLPPMGLQCGSMPLDDISGFPPSAGILTALKSTE